ncbi:hypothetical protein Q2T40_11735 [Winogradskyella maritima]|uniref:STAS/SEC14 domain-containing protein n=1 Tax=Winogradskyella maritima TaxID=1517766 RepID=A0ABV8AI83_9FLAO|nr:hypothetical protein [Winogradskyella maritima]
MKFEASPIAKSQPYQRIELPFGNYFLLDNYFVMEVHEGEHIDTEKVAVLIESLITHYGSRKKLAYIANRINNYSIDPILWSYFDAEDNILVAASIISYRESTAMSATLEKELASISIKRASNLDEAVEWISTLKELN